MEYNVLAGKFGTFFINPGSRGDGLSERDTASLTSANTLYPEIAPVMQFTGLKDRSSTEIYEGDIIRISAFEPPLNIVRFDGGGFCLEQVLGAPMHSSFWSDIKYAEDERSEVIGNIHENPELLEKP